MGAPGAGVSTTDVSTTGVSTTGAPPVLDEAQRRRARAVERQRRAAELKKSRTAQRQATGGHERREREHRSALLVMVLTLGLLIAAVAVTGGMIAASMRTRPVALAAPLHVYPVTQTVPGPCQAGTQGITGQTASGQVCYQLAQGIAIRKVADLRQQKARGAAHDVAVTLRADDRKAFAALTKTSVGRDLAFVVGDRLVTTSRVDMEISDGKFILTGSSSQAEADRLVRDLKGR
ncbi:SecDF P1 head subdomain-containing protein [Actinomadura macrotermitis]|nr:hypothetical protein [Actinomadura macrotermitis]